MTETSTVYKMYATSAPLEVRIRTHALYTQPEVDFTDWVLGRIPWRGDEVVLDIGCGSGSYAAPVAERLRRGGRLIGGDLSLGMLRDLATKGLPERALPLNANVLALPLPGECCDVVLANHVLQHVPQIETALSGIHRILRPDGVLVAATNSCHSMEAFFVETEAALNALGYPVELPVAPARTHFTLENGGEFLRQVFPRVEQHTLESALVFPEAAPAAAYIDSLRGAYESLLPPDLAWETLIAQVQRQIEAHVNKSGAYTVPKTAGAFVATRE